MELKLRHVAPVVLAIWVVGGIVVWCSNASMGERGQFGDMFGAVNALFTGMAFAGLFLTLQKQDQQMEMQRDELKLQREELQLQREEMKGSRAELANQVAAQKAMVRATVAQIAVTAQQARIEAIKVRTGHTSSLGRDTAASDIESVAKSISALTDKIEFECNAFIQPDKPDLPPSD